MGETELVTDRFGHFQASTVPVKIPKACAFSQSTNEEVETSAKRPSKCLSKGGSAEVDSVLSTDKLELVTPQKYSLSWEM